MKTILAFDTASPLLSVALGTREGKVYEIRSRSRLQHSEYLIPFVERLIRGARVSGRSPLRSLDDIDVFAIDRGPGSFTGLRIGFSLLKGFRVVKERPCYGALSLDMIAAKVDLPEGSRLGVLMDARREAIYARFYQKGKAEWKAEGKPDLFSLNQLKARIREGTSVVGDAGIRYRGELGEIFKSRIHFLKENLQFPSAATLVRWYQTQDPRLSSLKTQKDFLPLYFRAPEAEEKRRKR